MLKEITVVVLGGSYTNVDGSGSLSLIVEDDKSPADYYNSLEQKYVSNPGGRCNIALHEIIGHGRSLSVGRGAENQHEDAILFENLLLRVMGYSHIQRDGSDHGTRVKITEPQKLPAFR